MNGYFGFSKQRDASPSSEELWTLDDGPALESGVYPHPLPPAPGSDMNQVLEQVTLVVYGWNNVEPGTLSWIFPSLRAALAAVGAMKNAMQWVVVQGGFDREIDVETMRHHGAVLAEQLG